ncbi:phage antirepressor N-terminal domain-containing protein [Aurantimonas sp. A3-2-R12]|uniref:phage antirepressor N-terminal domain-containing protein n=1 Tax=Aurantimonas sp. A3-2-R12 TaxID=3114362 RepID=UPI002E1757DA|nr:phage antirepressor N-terminal domain-containing protein [Aurantimonas sp. A3-2-R12]
MPSADGIGQEGDAALVPIKFGQNSRLGGRVCAKIKAITTIQFHGATLFVQPGDSPETTLVAMKPLVEGMELAWQPQHKKLSEHPVLSQGVTEIVMPSPGGNQSMTALPLNRRMSPGATPATQ